MSTKVQLFLVLLIVFFFAPSVHSFETHRTNRILDQNILSLNVIKSQLGQGIHDNLSTHPWLTVKSIESAVRGGGIGSGDRTEMVLGSIAEDFDLAYNISSQSVSSYPHFAEFPNEGIVLLPYGYYLPPLNPQDAIHSDRAQNHFYSGGYTPQATNGLVGRLNDPKLLNSTVANIFFNLSQDRESAVYWALNSSINGAGFSSINSQTSNSRNMRILGHLLHILQDMGVPEHVRDDAHASWVVGPSPYEERLGDLTFEQHEAWAVGTPLMAPETRTDLYMYFEELSAYTRTHFFSSDTIFSTKTGMSLDLHIANWNFNNVIGPDRYVTGQIEGVNVRLARYNWRGILRHSPYLVTLGGYSITITQPIPYPVSYDEAAAESDGFSIDDEGIVQDYWRVMKPRILAYCGGFIDKFMAIYITQPPTPSNNYWAKTYDTFADLFPKDADIKQTTDNGFILSAVTDVIIAQDRDIVVAKLTNNGSLAWAKTYGGPGIEENHSIIQTIDGGYILAGYTTSYGTGIWDIWVLKLNQDGSIAWQKAYGGVTGSGNETGPHIFQTSDGSYLLVGNSSFPSLQESYHINILKLDGNGNILWQKKYGLDNEQTHVDSASLTSDGGCVLTGYYKNSPLSSASSNPIVIKINQSGNVTWANIYKSNLLGGNLFSVAPASDGGYVVSGTSYLLPGSISSEWKMLIMKLTSTGIIVWDKIYYVDKNEIGLQQYANAINQILDGGYIVSGMGGPIDNVNTGLLLFKVDGNGAVMWAHNYSNYAMWSFTISQTKDSGFITAGMEDNYTWVLKIPPDGNIIFNSTTNAKLLYPTMYTSMGDFINENITISETNGNIVTNNSNATPAMLNLIVNTQSP